MWIVHRVSQRILAAAANADPVAFRLAHLKDPRAKAVIEKVAAISGWKPGEKGDGRRGRGIAFSKYKNLACYVACVADVEIDRASGRIRVPRVWAAVDSGLVINPDGLTNQIEGGVIQSASWTLREQVHFDRNGFAYTLDRVSGELLVAEKFDPAVNWATKVDMDKSSATYGRPLVVSKYSTEQNGEDTNTQGVCPAALGVKDQQPASYDAATGLFLVPTNHVCMDYEPFRVSYTAGQPYVGATLEMYPAGKVLGDGTNNTGNFIAWDAKTGKIVWSNKEQFSVWSGAVSTDGGVTFYGTLEGYLKAVDTKTGKELYKFKTPSGIIGNVITYESGGKQYVAVLSGVGGWALSP